MDNCGGHMQCQRVAGSKDTVGTRMQKLNINGHKSSNNGGNYAPDFMCHLCCCFPYCARAWTALHYCRYWRTQVVARAASHSLLSPLLASLLPLLQQPAQRVTASSQVTDNTGLCRYHAGNRMAWNQRPPRNSHSVWCKKHCVDRAKRGCGARPTLQLTQYSRNHHNSTTG